MPVLVDGYGILPSENINISKVIHRYTLEGSGGLTVQVISYGARIISMRVPDKRGVLEEVALGFDDLEGYLENYHYCLSGVMGRVAHKIADACFRLDGKDYLLPPNCDPDHLNGGDLGFDKHVWESAVEGDKVVFSRLSKANEEGYPGNVLVQAIYTITPDNSLKLTISATATEPTPFAPASCIAVNLAGHGSGTKRLMEHYLSVNADRYLITKENLIPTGIIRPVGGTCYDLRIPRMLKKIHPLVPRGGYNNTLCITGCEEDGVRFVARLLHPPSGRILEVFSDQPCVQIDTISWLPPAELPAPDPPQEGEGDKEEVITEVVDNRLFGRNGALYAKHGAIIIQPLHYPNAVNYKKFPSCILQPGKTYKQTVIFRFYCKKPKKDETEPQPEPEQQEVPEQAEGEEGQEEQPDVIDLSSETVPKTESEIVQRAASQENPDVIEEEEEDVD